MAEGIARSLAPASVKFVRRVTAVAAQPLRGEALAEVGIDISQQFSKSVDDIPPGDVDAVVTLCAEEVCPVFLGKAQTPPLGAARIPRARAAPDEERLQAFRTVRDELQRRLAVVFSPSASDSKPPGGFSG